MVTPQDRAIQEFDALCARESYRQRGAREYERAPFIPTPDATVRATGNLRALLAKTDDLPQTDPVHRLMVDHFREFLSDRISSLKSSLDRPASFVGSLTSYIDFVVRKDSRPPEVRSELLRNRLTRGDEVWNSILTLFDTTKVKHLQEVRDSCLILAKSASLAASLLPDHFTGLSLSELARTENCLNELSGKALSWAKETDARIVCESPEEKPRQVEMDPAKYRNILSEELGVDLDSLLDWHEDEIAEQREGVLQLARRVRPSARTVKEAVDLLNEAAGPASSVPEMFARFRSYLDRAREAAKAYVDLPEESVRIAPVAEQHKAHYPWGGYGGGCHRRRPLLGEVFLNDSNLSAITDGWLKMMAIHECYPGHHVQFVRGVVDPLPETVKMGARSVPLTEGAAHRSERLFEFVFSEDPFYPLFVSYRRLHTVVRIKADLSLHYFGRSEKEVQELYARELGFDEAAAKGQVKAHQLMVGYFTTYYYGLKRISQLESVYSSGEKSFTNLLFSTGRVSLKTFEGFLALSEPDKRRFLTGFPSLLDAQ